jgi:iron complex outermembrane receptor protein
MANNDCRSTAVRIGPERPGLPIYKAFGLVLLALAAAPSVRSAEGSEAEKQPNFSDLSIEELMDVEITTASRKPEKLLEVPAAAFVITQEDIRRAGVRSIPEALRLAPGVEVEKINANKWAISIRGFNDRHSNKLLVLVDGRSVYTHAFSGIFWENQDTLIEDIERIEVIRGPGGTLWGANAVNGVINIITKRAKDTQGGLASAGGGTEELGFAGGRYGGKIGEETFYRLFAKGTIRDGSVFPSGEAAADDWQSFRGGFRLDSGSAERDLVSFQGDLWFGDQGNELALPALDFPYVDLADQNSRNFGGDIVGSWSRKLSETSSLALQTYYDGYRRDDPTYVIDDHTFDIDFQHRSQPIERNEFLWGLNYRLNLSSVDGTMALSFDGKSKTYNQAGLFLQDTVHVIEDTFSITVGSKFDYNDDTDFEIQPSARFLLTPHPRHAFWGAVSRAVRTPSRGDTDLRLVRYVIPPMPPAAPLPTQVQILGSDDFESEDLFAFDLGYRSKVTERLSCDVAGFFNLYDDLRSTEMGMPFLDPGPPPTTAVPTIFDNRVHGKTYGVEVAADWQATGFWKLSGSLSLLKMDLQADSGSSDATTEDTYEGRSPRHRAAVRSHLDLPWKLEFDTILYYVDSLGSDSIPSYVRLDFRLGWRPREDFELSAVLRNAFDDRHPEFSSEAFDRQVEIEREFLAYFTVRF